MTPTLHPLAAAVALAAAFGGALTACSRTDVPAPTAATTTITTTAPATITTNAPVTTTQAPAPATAPATTDTTSTSAAATPSTSTETTTAPAVAATTAPAATVTTPPATVTASATTSPATTAPGTSVGTKIDDTVVTAKVKSALLADQQVQALQIQVETRKGQVQLSGFADNQGQIERAMTVAKGVEGVAGVENAMNLKQGARTVGNKVDDGIVTAKVKSALLADPSVKALDIVVATNKGEVQLSGFVDSQMQIDQAIQVAKGIEGVQGVANKMTLKK